MSGFRTHLRVGAAVHLALTGLAAIGYLLSPAAATVLVWTAASLPLTLAGATVPDIDHPAATAYRVYRWLLPRLTALGVAAVTVVHARHVLQLAPPTPTAVPRGYLVGVGSMLLVGAVFHASARLVPVLRPRHRGVTHRVPIALVAAAVVAVGGLVVCAAFGAAHPSRITGPATAAFLAGYLSHLYVDGLLAEPATYLSLT